MTEHAGVLRSAASLDAALSVASRPPSGDDEVAIAEVANLAVIGRAVCAAAQVRTETRGAHSRVEHPDRDPVAPRRRHAHEQLVERALRSSTTDERRDDHREHGPTRDAAKALGLTFWPRIWYVILPQALPAIIPPWTNTAVEMVKGSSLAYLVSVSELLFQTYKVVGRTGAAMQLYIAAALLYFAINFALSRAGLLLERRVRYTT